ncbi:MAG: cysteine desulfurase [Oscillospiraceae bacterium]|nr:cysteine desulfurase [Oscillospiraceae bacterium]
MEHYLDNAATTRVCPEAAEAALAAMTECYGNPSSTHAKGREAKKLLDKARSQVAAAVGCADAELVFTASGTESDNWALLGGAEAMHRKGRHIISSAVEHDAVRKCLDDLESRGYEIVRLKPDETGAISPEAVAQALREDTILVSLMLVNNETGAVTDISAISRILREAKSEAILHTDAVQGFLKIPFSAKTLGADLISISGHKIHAPKGVGALYVRKGLRLKPLLLGGAQEAQRRAGTEALPAIAAFGAACEAGHAVFDDSRAHMKALRQSAMEMLRPEIQELQLIGGGAPHILSLSLPGWRSEVLINYLEAQEVYISRSSACKKGARSHVLEAMGLRPAVIDGAIRVSFSRMSTREDVDALCRGLIEAHARLSHR